MVDTVVNSVLYSMTQLVVKYSAYMYLLYIVICRSCVSNIIPSYSI